MDAIETLTVEQIRDYRENGPRTVDDLNDCDIALAALRGEFGAGRFKALQALERIAAAIKARAQTNSPTITVTPEPDRSDISDDALLAGSSKSTADLLTMIAMFHADGDRDAAVAILRSAVARLEDQ